MHVVDPSSYVELPATIIALPLLTVPCENSKEYVRWKGSPDGATKTHRRRSANKTPFGVRLQRMYLNDVAVLGKFGVAHNRSVRAPMSTPVSVSPSPLAPVITRGGEGSYCADAKVTIEAELTATFVADCR